MLLNGFSSDCFNDRTDSRQIKDTYISLALAKKVILSIENQWKIFLMKCL